MYSQYEEEKYIIDYLSNCKFEEEIEVVEDLNKNKPGFFKRFKSLFEKKSPPPLQVTKQRTPTLLDIGANDGSTHSNSLALIMQGFEALVVEPCLVCITEARRNYTMLSKNVTVVPCAIGNKTEPKTFWEFNQPYQNSRYGYFSTFRFFELPENQVRQFFTKTEVDTMDYKTLCDTYQRYQFDFITIDTCGHELQILPQIDLSKTKLVCVAYADNHTKEQIVRFCGTYGLRKVVYQSPANILIGR